jgi:subtilisin family serine protease
MNARLVVGVSALVGSLALPLAVPRAQQPGRADQRIVAGELIVKFSATVGESQRDRIVSDRGARVIRRFRALDTRLVGLAPGQGVATALAAFRRQPGVLLAQPNFVRRVVGPAPPDDPYWLSGFLWGLERIQTQPAWTSFTSGSADIVVAVLDTGVNYRHSDLSANMWTNPRETARNGRDDDGNGYVDDVYGIDTMNGDSDPMDDQGHGTHTAGTIAATGDNGIGIVGVAWGSRILSCKFIDASGQGTDAGAIECFNYVIELKRAGVDIRVTNNSWGSPRDGEPAAVLQATIDEAGAEGIVNVFAAGNDGTNNDLVPFDPASFSSASVIAVAASNQSDGRPGFSNYGASSVDLAAPGDFILSTYSNDYAFASGTSMAAPHVAGTAALLASKIPTLSVEAIKGLLMQTVDALPQWAGVVASGGRLNVLNAVTAAGGNIAPIVGLTAPAAGSAFPMSATVAVEATATDIDGLVSRVDFYANSVLVGTDSTGASDVFTASWTPAVAGPYSLTAVATDDVGATRTSGPVQISMVPPAGRLNVALGANGAVAVASSSYASAYPASGVINGDRKGLQWGNGGGWLDGTANVWPDWLEVQFSGPQTIEEIDVFMVQDAYASPSEPTLDMTFTKWGIRDFVVEYWTGSAWQVVPGGTVTGNTNVWRTFNFIPITTSRIRVWSTNGLASNSRLVEVEAYAVLGQQNYAPTVALTSPIAGSVFTTSTTLSLEATAADVDGTVGQVAFYANGALVGTATSETAAVYRLPWTPPLAGTYTLAAVATDDDGATRTSSPVQISIVPPAGRVNVALAANGAVAVASSSYSSAYPASGVINGDRKGLQWGNGGGWNDGTANVWPDWLEVQFNGPQTIEEIDVFMVQDAYTSPGEPTLDMTFTNWGIQDFVVEYWTGSTWQVVPGGAVTGNKYVWRKFHFLPVTTSGIRVWSTRGLESNSRLVELEAYAVLGQQNYAPTVALTAPAAGSAFPMSTTVALEATATDIDGLVSRVEFYANSVLVGSDSTGASDVFTASWMPAVAGPYSLTAVAIDDAGATRTSSPVQISIVPPAGRVNVALAANGAVAVASSSYSSAYPAGGVINGDRKGLQWGNGGGWNDGTANVWPDWLEVQFNGPQTIEEIDVFMVQDSYPAPTEPTLDMTFTKWGIRDFVVQYWTGTEWQPVPGGAVTGNTNVWRTFNFIPTTTSRIRVWSTYALASSSRLVEVEAYAVLGQENYGPSVTLTSPASGAVFPTATTMSLEATSTDIDGSVAQVAFYANGVLVGTDTTGVSDVYGVAWTPAVNGSYAVTAVATDLVGAKRTSSPVQITIMPPGTRVNVALAANGSAAVASSSYSGAYPASGVINGDRKGLQWGSGGGWNDGTANVWPDWLEVQFNGPQTIGEIDVFMVQDSYTAPTEPTLDMTFTKWGIRDFVVQYWTGSEWQPVPGGTVSGNTRVWRQFQFAPITTSRIRVWSTFGLGSSSRLVEVEAYVVIGG